MNYSKAIEISRKYSAMLQMLTDKYNAEMTNAYAGFIPDKTRMYCPSFSVKKVSKDFNFWYEQGEITFHRKDIDDDLYIAEAIHNDDVGEWLW